MSKELRPIDINEIHGTAELLHIVEELRQTHESGVIKRDGEDLAILRPVHAARRSHPRRGPITPNDPLFELVGIGKSGIPGGVSGKKHEYLARAYRPR